MTEQAPDSLNRSSERSTLDSSVYAANLLRFYSFDLGEWTIAELLAQWQDNYPENWVRLATIEALYQGRYKAISVEQILAFWQRRGQPLHHFNHDFERLVCNKLPRDLAPHPSPEPFLAPRGSRPPDSNVVRFPTSLPRPEFLTSIDPPETPQPETPQPETPQPETPQPETPQPEMPQSQTLAPEISLPKPLEAGNFPSARLRQVLEAESKLAVPGEDSDRAPAPMAGDRIAPDAVGTGGQPGQKPGDRPDAAPLPRSQPSKKAMPLTMPDFGLTPPQLSLKLRLQLAALYQPNWIVPAIGHPPLHRLVRTSGIESRTKTPPPKAAQSLPKAVAPVQNPDRGDQPIRAIAPVESHSPMTEDDLDDLKSDLW